MRNFVVYLFFRDEFLEGYQGNITWEGFKYNRAWKNIKKVQNESAKVNLRVFERIKRNADVEFAFVPPIFQAENILREYQ